MRIVAGIHKGKTLMAPKGLDTRPTSDRVRQALFNILEHASWGKNPLIKDACVLDAFSGTGALGLEALSRGATQSVFIELGREAQAVCHANIVKLGETGRALLIKADATRPPSRPLQIPPVTLAFLDPPYDKDLAATALIRLAEKGWLKEDALCIVEMRKQKPETPPPGFQMLDSRLWGDTRVDFWRRTPPA